MFKEQEIRRDRSGAIDVKYYTGRGRALKGLAIRHGVRCLASGIVGPATEIARRIFLSRPVPGRAKSP